MKKRRYFMAAAMALAVSTAAAPAAYAGPADEATEAAPEGSVYVPADKRESSADTSDTASSSTEASTPANPADVTAQAQQAAQSDPTADISLSLDQNAINAAAAEQASNREMLRAQAPTLFPAITDNIHSTCQLRTETKKAGAFEVQFDDATDGNYISAIAMTIKGLDKIGGISYRIYSTAGGYIGWGHDGELSNSADPGCDAQAIQVELTGYAEKEYDVYYRVTNDVYGTMGWAKNGEVAGAPDVANITGYEVRIVPKNFGSTPVESGQPRYVSSVTSRLHVAANATTMTNEDGTPYNGWLDDAYDRYYFQNGQAVTGWQYIDGYKFYFDENGVLDQDVEDRLSAENRDYILKVNKTLNCMTVYAKDGSNGYIIPVKAFRTSVGDDTPIGTFKTPQKFRWHLMIDDSYTQWATRITNGFMIHSITYESTDNKSLNVFGYNRLSVSRSHGCVRLTAANAKWVYENCPVGTSVTIYEDANTASPFMIPDQVPVSYAQRWDPTDPTVTLN